MSRRLPDFLDSYLHFTEETEPCELYRKWVGVSIVAAALQRKCYLRWGSQCWYPNLFIVLIGPPGEPRKGTAMASGYSILRPLNIKLSADRLTPEHFIKELSDSLVITQFEAGKLMNHCSITVFSKELTVFIGYKNSQFLADLTDLYDCADVWSYRTKNSGEYEVTGAFLNLLAATTPEQIQAALPAEAIGGGFASRVLFIYADKRGKTVPMPVEDEELKQKLTLDLEEISMLAGPFRATNSYAALRTEWYVSQTEETQVIQDARFAAYYSRKASTATKLSMILCASRTDDMKLREEDFVRAVQMLDEAEVHMPRALSGVGKSDYAEVLPQLMEEILKHKEVTMSHLMRRFSHDTTQFHLTKMIETLELMGVLKYAPLTRKVHANPEFMKSPNLPGDIVN
jgi:hypothetical protein